MRWMTMTWRATFVCPHIALFVSRHAARGPACEIRQRGAARDSRGERDVERRLSARDVALRLQRRGLVPRTLEVGFII
jgi:hypothetical protein